MPVVVHIETQDDYEQALELMDQLADDYDANRLFTVLGWLICRSWVQRATSAKFSTVLKEKS